MNGKMDLTDKAFSVEDLNERTRITECLLTAVKNGFSIVT